MIKAYTTQRINGCGDIHLSAETVTWHKITIIGFNKKTKIVHAVTDDGVVVDIPLRRVFKDKLESIMRPKDLKNHSYG